MDWFAVRCVFRTASDDGLFGERVTLWRADSFDAAVERAEEEARRYDVDLSMRYLGLARRTGWLTSPMTGRRYSRLFG